MSYENHPQGNGGFGGQQPPPPPQPPSVPPQSPAAQPTQPAMPPPSTPPAGPPSTPPAGPPSTPPAYGAPGGYGAPQQPAPYGAPPVGYRPPPPRSGGKGVLIVIVVLAVLAAVGGGGFYLYSQNKDDSASGSDGDKPKNTMHQVWRTKLDKSTKLPYSSGRSIPGFWLKDDKLIYGDENGLRAYDTQTGKKKWTTKPPKHAGQLCGMSRDMPDGIGIAVFDSGGDNCAYIAAVDGNSGTVIWSHNLVGDITTANPRIAIGHDRITTDAGGTVTTWSVKTGSAGPRLTARGEDCAYDIAFGGDYIVSGSSCSDAKPEDQLAVVDTEFGDIDRHGGVSMKPSQVLDDYPLTVLMADKADKKSFVQVFDKDNKVKKTFPLNSGKLDKLQFNPRTTYVSHDSTLITEWNDNAHFAAVDLKTGKLLWTDGRKTFSRVIGQDDKDAFAVADPPGGTGDHLELVSYNLQQGKRKVLGSVPVPQRTMQYQYAMDSSRLFVAGPDEKGRWSLHAYEVPYSSED